MSISENSNARIDFSSYDYLYSFDALQPGERDSRMLEINNQTPREINISLMVEELSLEQGEQGKNLLSKLFLTIWWIAEDGEKVTVFDGKISSKNQNLAVGSLSSGKEGRFFIEIYCPESVGNQYQGATDQLQWFVNLAWKTNNSIAYQTKNKVTIMNLDKSMPLPTQKKDIVVLDMRNLSKKLPNTGGALPVFLFRALAFSLFFIVKWIQRHYISTE